MEKNTSEGLRKKLDDLVTRARSKYLINSDDLLKIIVRANTVIMDSNNESDNKQEQQQKQQPQKQQNKPETKPDAEAKKTINKSKKDDSKPTQTKQRAAAVVASEGWGGAAATGNVKLLEEISDLFGKKKYTELVELFENRIKGNERSVRAIPEPFLSLVTCSLYFMVKISSIQKKKQLKKVI